MKARVYLGRDACRLAAGLIAVTGNEAAERMASYQVKRLAWKARPSNATSLVFWAAVLSRTDMKLADPIAVINDMSEADLLQIDRLERRSRAQVLPRGRRPVT